METGMVGGSMNLMQTRELCFLRIQESVDIIIGMSD